MTMIRHKLTGQEVPAFLAGVITPVFTPCGPGGAIDWQGFRDFIIWLRNHPSVTALFVRSGLGRMYTYTIGDTKQAIDIATEALDGRKPVMFGTFGEYFRDGFPSGVDLLHHRTIGNNRPDPGQYLDQTLELTEYARSHGAAAGVLVVPSALLPKPGMSLEDTIFDYYETVSKSVNLPLFIYNTPGLPEQYNTTPHMAARVSRLKNVIGMKLSTVDMQWMTEIAMAVRRTDFVLIAGSECTFYHALLSGACGVIGQGCDVNPEILRAVFDRFMASDLAGALEAQCDVLRALHLFEGLDAARSGLAYLRRKGLNVQGYGRFGEPPVPESEIERIERDLDPLIAKYRTYRAIS